MDIAIGFSAHLDPEMAAKTALLQIKKQLNNKTPTTIIILNSHENTPPDVIVRTIKREYDHTGLVGITTWGNIYDNYVSNHSLVLIAFLSDSPFPLAIGQHINSKPKEAFQHMLEDLIGTIHQHTPAQLLLFIDGLANESNWPQQLTQVFDKQLCVGLTSAHPQKGSLTWQYFDKQAISQSALAISFSDHLKVAIAITHNWHQITFSTSQIEAKTNTLSQIEGKSALTWFGKQLGNPQLSVKEFNQLQLGSTYPICIQTQKIGFQCNLITKANDDGSLVCLNPFEQNPRIALCTLDQTQAIDNTKQATQKAKNDLQDSVCKLGLIFASTARYNNLLTTFETEIKTIAETLDNNIPVVGCLTDGQIFKPTQSAESPLSIGENVIVLIGEKK